ncbi:glutamine amidotransferase [Novosphingobium sp. 9]|uniref:glutamine amidotransferase n=1 Tax=Novosphingobium sp. 9 TaxID=2025349 RepID=UPI0021B5D25C|nr:glutamine amidotransferase [Novosphingobium sp. 9]
MKSALVVRHVPHEGIAGYRAPIEAAGYVLDRVDVTDPAFAAMDLSAPDLLIMMGAPMSVYEQDHHAWIAPQIRQVSARIESGRATLGVCFGAQIVAAALGAEVYRGPAKEVGFHPVALSDAGASGPLRHLRNVPVLHWHGDTFTPPPNVEHLASSDLYAHQAFRRGEHLLALQFHAEMGLDPRFDTWVDAWPDDFAKTGQTACCLRNAYAKHGPGAVEAGRAMIAEWLEAL